MRVKTIELEKNPFRTNLKIYKKRPITRAPVMTDGRTNKRTSGWTDERTNKQTFFFGLSLKQNHSCPVATISYVGMFYKFWASQLPNFLIVMNFRTYSNHIIILIAVNARARNKVPRRFEYQPPLPKNQVGDGLVFWNCIQWNLVKSPRGVGFLFGLASKLHTNSK